MKGNITRIGTRCRAALLVASMGLLMSGPLHAVNQITMYPDAEGGEYVFNDNGPYTSSPTPFFKLRTYPDGQLLQASEDLLLTLSCNSTRNGDPAVWPTLSVGGRTVNMYVQSSTGPVPTDGATPFALPAGTSDVNVFIDSPAQTSNTLTSQSGGSLYCDLRIASGDYEFVDSVGGTSVGSFGINKIPVYFNNYVSLTVTPTNPVVARARFPFNHPVDISTQNLMGSRTMSWSIGEPCLSWGAELINAEGIALAPSEDGSITSTLSTTTGHHVRYTPTGSGEFSCEGTVRVQLE